MQCSVLPALSRMMAEQFGDSSGLVIASRGVSGGGVLVDARRRGLEVVVVQPIAGVRPEVAMRAASVMSAIAWVACAEQRRSSAQADDAGPIRGGSTRTAA